MVQVATFSPPFSNQILLLIKYSFKSNEDLIMQVALNLLEQNLAKILYLFQSNLFYNDSNYS